MTIELIAAVCGTLATCCGFLIMWLIKSYDKRLEKHGAQIDALANALGAINVLIAGDYVKRGEFKEELDKVHHALRQLAIAREKK